MALHALADVHSTRATLNVQYYDRVMALILPFKNKEKAAEQLK